jgi:Uma2 family endonuclease
MASVTAVQAATHHETEWPNPNLQLVELFPAPGDWTEEEYLWLTDRTNHLAEYCDGRIEILPMPTDFHQTISLKLLKILLHYFEPTGGKVLYSPIRIRLFSGRFREPDLVVLASADDPRRENRYWHGADLVMEIVSPDDPARDLVTKRQEYAEAGIPEYWIVDPRSETITVLKLDASRPEDLDASQLEEKVYAEHGTFGRGATATSAHFDGLGVDVEALFTTD